MLRLPRRRPAARPRPAFTLIELLVVLLIVSIIAAVTLPVVIPAISHRQVGESARIIQGGLVAARDAALRTNSPHGIRFLPDPAYNAQVRSTATKGDTTTVLDPSKILASNRFIPIEQPPGYSEGKVFFDIQGRFAANFSSVPLLGSGISSGPLYTQSRILMIVQAVRQGTILETPTAWYWNARVGDKIQVNNVGPYFTVVGPVDTANPELFVNLTPNSFSITGEDGVTLYPEILFVVNGQDDDGDGYVDNGWDGVDNDNNGTVDDLGEWSERESWPSIFTQGTGGGGFVFSSNMVGNISQGLPYTLIRRPVPSPGARETVLPGNAVVDLTGSFYRTRERSRLPVDPLSGEVDILLDPSGRVVPTISYSSPSGNAMDQATFYHLWVGERSDLADLPAADGSGNRRLVSGYDFALPMPADAYPAIMVNSNPTLPQLKGEMRLLTLFARTGNLMTTDRPPFDVTNTNRPFHAAQIGEQGDTP